jgi:hypothetical protein
MTDDLDALQRQLDELTAQRDRAAGAAEEVRRQMKEEFGVSDQRRAAALLDKLKAREGRLRKKAAASLAAFRREFGDKLEET